MTSEWNFWMNPPVLGSYSSEELHMEMIHSAKAYFVCHTPAEAFVKCRRGVEGSLVKPEKCLGHSLAVFNCYQETKIVPKKCLDAFSNTLKCLRSSSFCEENIQEYLRCEHPAADKYAGYQ